VNCQLKFMGHSRHLRPERGTIEGTPRRERAAASIVGLLDTCITAGLDESNALTTGAEGLGLALGL
jgi:hypothetical protein